MEPIQGDRVKLFFRNGLVEEGIVMHWSSTRAVLGSFSSDNVLIIQNTENDIIAIKVYRDKTQIESRNPSAQVYVDDDLQPDKYYRDENLRALSLVQLRQRQAQEERKRARELTTSFTPNGSGSEAYDPERTTIPRGI